MHYIQLSCFFMPTKKGQQGGRICFKFTWLRKQNNVVLDSLNTRQILGSFFWLLLLGGIIIG